jgi:integrase
MKKKSNLTLWQYLVDIYIPERMKLGKLDRRGAWSYRCKVRRFMEAAGGEIKLTDITEALLLEVEEKLAKTYRRSTATFTLQDVRVILRHWNPDQFPDHRLGGANARPQFAESEIKGTLAQIFVDDYLPERTSISSPQTIRQYSRCLLLFSRYLGHECAPADLTDRVVGKFLRWLVEVEGVKAVTANGYVKQLKAMWTWLAKKRVVAEFPTVAKLKQPDPIPIAWSREEFQKLYKACTEQVGFVGPVLANLFWTAFYRVLWDSGERTGAMLALRWSWLDMKSGHLTVPGEYRKGGTQPMIYRLKPATLAALRKIAKLERELIFDLGDRKEKNCYFYSCHRDLVKSAGLPYEARKSGPQKGRRTFASFIEAAGGNATKALKHRDRRVTEDSYLDPKITEVESENEKLFPLDGDIA